MEKNSRAASKYDELFQTVSARIVREPKDEGELDAMYVSGTGSHVVGDYEYLRGKFTIIEEERIGSSLDIKFEENPPTSRSGYYSVEKGGKVVYYNFHIMNDAFYCLSTHKDVFLWRIKNDDDVAMVLVVVDVNGDCGIVAPAVAPDDNDVDTEGCIFVDTEALKPKENVLGDIRNEVDSIFDALEW